MVLRRYLPFYYDHHCCCYFIFSGHCIWRFLELKAQWDIEKILLLPEFHEADINLLLHKPQAGYCFKWRLCALTMVGTGIHKRIPSDNKKCSKEKLNWCPSHAQGVEHKGGHKTTRPGVASELSGFCCCLQLEGERMDGLTEQKDKIWWQWGSTCPDLSSDMKHFARVHP